MEVSGRKDDRKGTVKGVICQPCRSDGDVIKAEGYCETCNEFFCSSCLGFHRKQSMTRNHVIRLNDEMPSVGGQTDPCLEPCSVHKTEVVKFYCAEHDFVGCGDCMVLDHKTCKVVLVQSVSGEYKNGDDLKNLIRVLEELKMDFVFCHQNVKQNLKSTHEWKKKAMDAVKKFREEMNDYLDTVETKVLKEVEQLESEGMSLQNELKNNCASVEKEIEEFLSKLSTESEKINQLFVMANFAKKRMHTYQHSLEQIKRRSQMNNYYFEPSKSLLNHKQSQIPLGNLVASKLSARNPPQKRDHVGRSSSDKSSLVDKKARPLRRINAKLQAEHNCYISGLAMITDTEIVLADRYNKSLKVVNIAQNIITGSLTASSAPWDVTAINAGTVAATLPDERKIVFVSANDKMSDTHCLKTKYECRGIDFQHGMLAVSCCSPPVVHIIDLDGGILNEIKIEYTVSAYTPFPGHIVWSNDSDCFWLSDNGSNEVSKVTTDGQIKAEVISKRPRGLVVSSDGTVLVCAQSNRNNIGIIPPDTNEMKSMELENVRTPHTVLLCEKLNTLFIAEYSTDCNAIKVFKLE